jgi:hypothetical protein
MRIFKKRLYTSVNTHNPKAKPQMVFFYRADVYGCSLLRQRGAFHDDGHIIWTTSMFEESRGNMPPRLELWEV